MPEEGVGEKSFESTKFVSMNSNGLKSEVDIVYNVPAASTAEDYGRFAQQLANYDKPLAGKHKAFKPQS